MKFEKKKNTEHNVVILCNDSNSDGRSRAGVYCAANACIEQVIQHGEVDIFQAVKTVRRQRPQLVENMVSAVLYTYAGEFVKNEMYLMIIKNHYTVAY